MGDHGTLDFETKSAAGFVWDPAANNWTTLPGARFKGLKAIGAPAYSEHPTTDILTLSYKLPPHHAKRRWRPGEPLPQDLFDYLAAGGVIEAHNAMFEWLIWTNVAVRRYGFPTFSPYQMRCSMAKAHVAGYPGGLGELSKVLRLAIRKDADGDRLLKKFSIPQKPTKLRPNVWIMPEDDPADFERLRSYCDTDVDAEEQASEALPPLTNDELLFWWIDQEINRRGIAIDRAAVRDCIAVLNQALDQYGEEFRVITGGLNPTQLEATRGWLAARGVYMSSMDEAALDEALGPGAMVMAPECRRVLEIRQLIGSASVKKLFSMENQCCADDRLRNLLVHHGARTGRPTGEGPQPLNLPRAGPDLYWCDKCHRPFGTHATVCPWCSAPPNPAWKTKWSGRPKGLPESTLSAVDFAVEITKARNLALVEFYFGDALLTISGCLRGLFVAGSGLELIASDYSAIEAVVLACMAGEQWRIDAFNEGKPIYLVGASKITGTSLDAYLAYYAEHGEHHPDRQTIGKVSELACFTPETQVLTDQGYVDIAAVTLAHRLWDGVEWVSHGGLISKGLREVLSLDGVKMTPDHLINCRGSWKPASRLVSSQSLLALALATGLESLPSSGGKEACAKETCGFNARAARRHTASPFRTYPKGPPPVAGRAPPKPPGLTENSILGMPIWFPTMATGEGCSTGYPHVSPVAVRATPPRARRATPAGESVSMSRGAMGLTAGGSFSPTSSPFRGGITRLLNWTGSRLTAIMNRGIFGLSPSERTRRISDPSKICSGESMTLSPTFDIAHAGPRNRFTIKTDSGHLIVHNCGFGGWIGSYKAFGSTEDDATIKAQILAWRRASPAIVEFWGGQFRGAPWDPDSRQEYFGVEGAAVQAILHPDMVFDFRGLKFFMRDHVPDQVEYVWETDYFLHGDNEPHLVERVTKRGKPGALIIRLLSGRELRYNEAEVRPAAREWSRKGELSISYMTHNSNPKYGPMGWVPMETYGGRLTENIVQATAHDIQRFGILALRAAGYPTVLHVYDENVCEVPEGTGSIEEFERIMSTMPPWAAWWPIRASGGWRGYRYRKG